MSVRAMTWAFDVELDSPSAKLVLLALADHADEFGKCWPSQETLARKTSQSIDSVQRRLKELVSLGFLTYYPRRRASSIYQILWSDSLKPQSAVSKTLEPQIDVKEPQKDLLEPQLCGTEPSLRTIKIEPSKKEIGRAQRGAALPCDWKPNIFDFEYGKKLGLSNFQIDEMAEDLRLWAGANSNRPVGKKADWNLAFKGWMRRESKNGKSANSEFHNQTSINGNGGQGRSGGNRRETRDDVILAGMRHVASKMARDRIERESNGAIPIDGIKSIEQK